MNEPTRNRFTFATAAYAPGELEVVSIVGSESISSPFGFDIEAIVNADRGPIGELLGGRARLAFHGVEGRQIAGIVTRIEAHPPADDLPVFRFHLAPTIWLLGLRKTTRIFQDMSVPEIVRAVLSDVRIEHAFRLETDYPKREYCVQYRETDLAFVTRLLAEEGIFYFIADAAPEDSDAHEVVVFSDTVAEYRTIAGNPALQFRDTGGLEGAEQVTSFSFGEEVRSGSTLHRSFDFKRPMFELRGESRLGGRTNHIDLAELSVYDHDGDPEERRIHGTAAKASLQQLRAQSATGMGESTCQRLLPAGTFELSNHPHGELSRRYVVTRIDHEVHQVAGRRLHATGVDAYKNRFHCVPEHVPYRPARPRRELHQVTETATVVGPPGEEIHVDEYGRIKVQFHWDLHGKNDEHSSCWLRTMQPWAGAAWGSQFIPRVGMEVVVTFVGGDIDRPMVLGSVYNALHPTPFKLPDNKTQSGIRTRSTPGGAGSNELRFEDAAGSEQVYLHAQKDHDELVENNHTRTVKGDEAVNILRTSRMDVGSDQELNVVGNETVTIAKDFVFHVVGQQIIHIDGNKSEGKGSTSAEAPDPQAVPTVAPADPGTSGPALEMLEKELFGQRVAAAKLLFLGEQVPDELYAQGQEIRSHVASAQQAVTEVHRETLALPASVMGTFDDPISGEALAQRLDVAIKAGAVRREIDETLAGILPPLPLALQPLQSAAVEHLHDLALRAERFAQGLALSGPDGLRAVTLPGLGLDAILGCAYSGASSEDAGDGHTGSAGEDPGAGRNAGATEAPGPPPGPGTVASSTGAKRPKVPPMPKESGVKGFENKKASMNIAGGPGTIVAPKGFAIKAGGATISMKGGVVEITANSAIHLKAPTVTVSATTVSVVAGKILMDAGKITELGGTITLIAQGALTAMGGPIRLN